MTDEPKSVDELLRLVEKLYDDMDKVEKTLLEPKNLIKDLSPYSDLHRHVLRYGRILYYQNKVIIELLRKR